LAEINRRAAREPVKVTPSLFRLLGQAKAVSEQTGGTFDITIAPLVRCWGFMGGDGRLPTPEEVQAARKLVGMDKVLFDVRERTIRFSCPGVMLDLGAIGKGYAVERGLEILREAGVGSALFHGGTSTVGAIGHPPDTDAWRVAVNLPTDDGSVRRQEFHLRDVAMSASSGSGRKFTLQGQTFGHVLDPRTGQPVAHAALAVVVAPKATETDALSTALLTLGTAGQKLIGGLRAGLRTLVVDAAGVATTTD